MEESEPLLVARFEERSANGRCRWSLRTPNMDPRVVEDLRRRLKYFFMNPCQKYKARGRKPWKLMLQILKIALITAQLVSFGLSNEMMVTFKDENLMTFRHLFLKGYKDHRLGGHVLHTKTDVYDHIYYIIHSYINLQNLTVGNLAYEKIDGEYTPLLVCQEFYRNSNIDPGNETFYIDPRIDTDCFAIYPVWSLDNGSLATPLNFSLDFRRLLSVNVDFTLKTINLQTVRHHELPDCYVFHVVITFDNHAHSGNIKVAVGNDVTINECRDWNVEGTCENDYLLLFFDSVVILACFTSLILCVRSVVNGIQLQFEFNTFFHAYYNRIVTMSDRMEFVNGWYILIIVSDTLTIAGSALKIGIQTKFMTSYDECSILLGTATMMVWVGVIRYLGFFKKYNILILTLRAAFPNVIRFCCCAAMIYLGYCFCGWIVLGPYHDKFRTLDKVTECLFSLVNGDDMYATFMKMPENGYMVWLFSRLYLYSFISLFIYMVLSLFIALITDTYETIKELGFQILGNKMSNKRLSNASPPPERFEAQPQDHIPPPMSSMGDLREFMDPYNFDPINNRPLPDGSSEWSVVGDTPVFDSQPPHYSGESLRSQNGGSRPSGTTGDNACIHKDGDLMGTRGATKTSHPGGNNDHKETP